MPPPPGQITHLVVLMMENRSFDHMLGYLKSADYPIDGLNGNEANPDSSGEPVQVSSDANYSGDFGNDDPGHHFPDVTMQIFGNAAGTGAPTMSGFVQAYAQKCGGNTAKSRRIMKCFSSKRIPVITTLAQAYAVCDRWFSSVPGPTLPNRSFAHAATSIGRLDMNPTWFDEGMTIYELLLESGVSSKIYFHDMSVAQTFKNLLNNQDKYFGTVGGFLDACQKGTLPAYSFIEPRYNADNSGDALPASDQHPDHDVHEGETLILDVYNAVRKSPLWSNTILLIVYDEHGGIYDHVPPPATVNPDGKLCADPPFDFTRLGVRVPAVVVSPWVEAATIDSTVYDHASIIATARKLLLGAGWQTKFLTARDRNANTFEGLLTLDAARTDSVDPTQPYRQTTPAVRAARQAQQPLNDLQTTLVQMTSMVNQTLPAAQQSTTTPADVQTEADAAAFHKEVLSQAMPGTSGPSTAGAGQ